MDTLEQSRATVRARVASLRAAMRTQHIAATLIPSSDPHLSEYLPERWKGREWISGFTGSVGTLVVTANFAGLWVDTRYWVQADAELAGTGIAVIRIASAASAGHVEWLAEHMATGDAVAVDGRVLGLAAARVLADALAAHGATLRADLDLLDTVWPDRPAAPAAPVYEHAAPYAPVSRAVKLAALRAAIAQAGAQWHVVSTLDDIAWLFNLRGSDVSYNPVFIAHALIGPERVTLFVGDGKVPESLQQILVHDGVDVVPYADTTARLGALPAGARVFVDPRRITLGLRNAIAAGAQIVEGINPTTLAKSRKTDAEAAHVRLAMEYDGAALAEFFAWFEQALGREPISELTIDERITAARARQPGFVSPSFATIAAFNANGAMPHYHATPLAHAKISRRDGIIADGLLLIDSGGQYLDGTTDITRVVAVGTPSAEQKRDFTLVLKGMIGLSTLRFPRGTRSPLLDSVARAPIWAAGVDYGHGTGHGVGYFLNVHEGPHGITPYLSPEPQTAMEPGMITSNEPGIYRPGQWGVRIENLLLNVPDATTPFGEFLRFETLTLCPIDTRCIDRSLMRDDEIAWLNAYHATVCERVLPHLHSNDDARSWIRSRTAPI